MTVLMFLFLLFLFYLVWFYVLRTEFFQRNLSQSIPGPFPWPFLGNLIDVGRAHSVTFLALHELQKRHGPIMALWMGHNRVIVVSGRDELKAIMHDPSFDARGPLDQTSPLSRVYTGSDVSKGILFHSGPTWMENRRFALKSLRAFGLGRSSAEMLVKEESECMITYIEHMMGQDQEVIVSSSCLSELFTMMALNVIWQMCAGCRYDYSSSQMLRLIRFIDYFNVLGSTFLQGPLAAFPALASLPPFREKKMRCDSMMAELRVFFRKCIDEHRQTRDEREARDYIDAFLMKENESEAFKEDHLVTVLMDLFLAGTETSAKSMLWASLFMIKHPETQHAVQAELASNVGADLVENVHRPQLPLTDATLQEVFRLGPVGPIAAVRYCSKDTIITGGLKVPKGSLIMPNLYSMTVDERLWHPDPLVFRPQRHLGNDDRERKMFTFGLGRRKCLGESVARVENFVFFANLLHKFSLSKVEELDDALQPLDGLTVGPSPFRVRITKRRS